MIEQENGTYRWTGTVDAAFDKKILYVYLRSNGWNVRILPRYGLGCKP